MEKPFTGLNEAISVNGKDFHFFSLPKLAQKTGVDLACLPFSIRILLEGCYRQQTKNGFSPEAVKALLNWKAAASDERPVVPFLPARVLLQDFTGLPVLNDLTALRAALKRQGKDPPK